MEEVRPMMRICEEPNISDRCLRNASRIQRLTRLRLAAFPIRFGERKPARVDASGEDDASRQ